MEKFAVYICPKCGKKLYLNGGSLRCEEGHCYDVSSAGYVNLVAGSHRTGGGDGDFAVAAREKIMDAGYYRKLCDCIAREDISGRFLDVGTADGSLPGQLKAAFPNAEFYGTDLSKFAIKHAAKRYKDVGFAVANSAKLPVASGSVDWLSAVFTTIFPEEFSRVLAAGGRFIRVTPGREHLIELRRKLYDEVRENETGSTVKGFTRLSSESVRDVFRAEGELSEALIGMTPYGVRSSKARREAIKGEPIEVTLEFIVEIFKKEE